MWPGRNRSCGRPLTTEPPTSASDALQGFGELSQPASGWYAIVVSELEQIPTRKARARVTCDRGPRVALLIRRGHAAWLRTRRLQALTAPGFRRRRRRLREAFRRVFLRCQSVETGPDVGVFAARRTDHRERRRRPRSPVPRSMLLESHRQCRRCLPSPLISDAWEVVARRPATHRPMPPAGAVPYIAHRRRGKGRRPCRSAFRRKRAVDSAARLNRSGPKWPVPPVFDCTHLVRPQSTVQRRQLGPPFCYSALTAVWFRRSPLGPPSSCFSSKLPVPALRDRLDQS